MTAQHPMSELLRAKAALGDEASVASGLEDAANALDAMQAENDRLHKVATQFMHQNGSLMAEKDALQQRWDWLLSDPVGARHMLQLLLTGKGTPEDFTAMVDRIAESKNAAERAHREGDGT